MLCALLSLRLTVTAIRAELLRVSILGTTTWRRLQTHTEQLRDRTQQQNHGTWKHQSATEPESE